MYLSLKHEHNIANKVNEIIMIFLAMMSDLLAENYHPNILMF